MIQWLVVKLSKLFLSIVLIVGVFLVPKTALLQSQPSEAAERCALSQSYLKKIQKNRDLHARVDRLQAYQYIYQRIDVFVRRLERNSQPQAAEMRATLDQLTNQLESFKKYYEEYDQAREATANVVNCKNKLAEFQSKLTIARSKRETLQNELLEIQKTLDPVLKTQLETVQNAVFSDSMGVKND